MKIIIALIIGISLVGCTTKTEFGDCIGIGDDKNPKLKYKTSANNIVWAILGIEFIAPPVIVLVDETYCPIGENNAP